MARDCWKPKRPGAPSAESRPFSRHREECIIVGRLAWFYRGRGVEIFESCLVKGSRAKRLCKWKINRRWHRRLARPFGNCSLLTITCSLTIRTTSAFFELYTLT
jgi:hypothetical protein